MKMKILMIGVVVAITVIGAGVYLYQKPSETVVSEESSFEVDAFVFFNEFNEDEAKANQKYLNKVVTVKGKVSDISAMDSLGVNVMLETNHPMFGVSCQLPSGVEQTPLKVGDQVAIRGLCTGKLMDVVMIKCLLEKNQKSI